MRERTVVDRIIQSMRNHPYVWRILGNNVTLLNKEVRIVDHPLMGLKITDPADLDLGWYSRWRLRREITRLKHEQVILQVECEDKLAAKRREQRTRIEQ